MAVMQFFINFAARNHLDLRSHSLKRPKNFCIIPFAQTPDTMQNTYNNPQNDEETRFLNQNQQQPGYARGQYPGGQQQYPGGQQPYPYQQVPPPRRSSNKLLTWFLVLLAVLALVLVFDVTYLVLRNNSDDKKVTAEMINENVAKEKAEEAAAADKTTTQETAPQPVTPVQQAPVQQAPAPQAQPAAQPAPSRPVNSNSGGVYTTDNNLFLRTGPGAKYSPYESSYSDFYNNYSNGAIVGIGSTVRIISGVQNGFVRIRMVSPSSTRDGYTEGWVSRKHLY